MRNFRIFFPCRLNKPEHLFGKKVAMDPAMQIEAKIEPISGFLQEMFSICVGVFSANINTVNNPMNERLA